MTTDLHIVPRPAVELGTYAYWRCELRDFWILMQNERDPKVLQRAYAALLVVAGKTEPADPVEEAILPGELAAATYRFERAYAEAS